MLIQRYTGKHQPQHKGKRKPSTKKKIRDLERLISKEGMPQEIIEAKKKDIEELKKELRYFHIFILIPALFSMSLMHLKFL